MTNLTSELHELLTKQGAPILTTRTTIRSLTHDEFLKEAYRIVRKIMPLLPRVGS